MTNIIPPITDPLGKHWQQPDPAGILTDESHALMTVRALKTLLDYSHSQPTGVYPGKMWRSHAAGVAYLHWFDVSEKGPAFCSHHVRIILTV